MSNLVRIDELLIREHGSLSLADECYYLLEYTAREGYSFSTANDLVQNLKKPMDRKGRPEWKWKTWAIQKIAQELTPALPVLIDFATTTIIPVPPSKIRANPLYDDRLIQILHKSCPTGTDIREVITCREDMTAAHESDQRPSVQEIMDNYLWNDPVRPAIRPNVVFFDDMVTGGNHYVACRNFLRERYPDSRIVGVFVARRVLPPTSPFDDFDDFEDI
jgi:hypothetical protein